VEFGVLGPLEVRTEDGREVAIGAAKRRAVLAALLLRRNELVPLERLIDQLWGEHPPATEAQAVINHVSQLRKALGPDAVVTRPLGYLLRVEKGALDLDRFEELLERGRALLAGGAAAEAAAALREALGLWRGPPFADFSYEPFAQNEIGRLTDLRLVALERRLEADLALGRHAETVPELEALVREHPLRETLCGLLMLALYRSGRQADALAAYQASRAALVEELGLDPSPALQQLEHRILRQDPSLDEVPTDNGRRRVFAVPVDSAPVREPAPEEFERPDAQLSNEVPLPPVLKLDVAAERVASGATERRGRRRWVAIVAAVAGVAAAAIAAVELVGHVEQAAAAPSSVIRLDPRTNRVAADVQDSFGCACDPAIWSVDGTLWEWLASRMTIRDLRSGRVLRTFALPRFYQGLAIGFGAVWLAQPGIVISDAPTVSTVERIDEVSGRVIARVRIPGDLRNGAIAIDQGAVWVLVQEGTLYRIDPTTNRITGRFNTGALETFFLAAAGGYEWIPEIFNHAILRYDARTRTAKTFHYNATRWLASLAGYDRRFPFIVGSDGRTRTLWILDAPDAVLVPIDIDTGTQAGGSVGLAGQPAQAVLARGSIWVAAGPVVDRLVLATGAHDTITLPNGADATGIAVDPVTNTVWVANSQTNGA
jgi:DNA-binding SARP family transcriptional activator